MQDSRGMVCFGGLFGGDYSAVFSGCGESGVVCYVSDLSGMGSDFA
jgi:hypothetical protein